MQLDPGEMRDLADSAEYADVLKEHRRYLAEYIKTTNDDFAV